MLCNCIHSDNFKHFFYVSTNILITFFFTKNLEFMLDLKNSKACKCASIPENQRELTLFIFNYKFIANIEIDLLYRNCKGGEKKKQKNKKRQYEQRIK